MESVAVPYAVAALLLVLAGGQKLRHPADASGALHALGLPSGWRLVRAGAAVEIVIGVAALAVPSAAVAGLVALAYLGFAGFVVAALRSGTPIASCGCFGREDTPPDALHLVGNLLFAGVAVAVAGGGGLDLAAVLADQPWAGVPAVGFAGLLTFLAVTAYTQLPRTMAIVRHGP